VADIGKLPDIPYVEKNDDDGFSPSEEEISPGVYEISLFRDARYKMYAEGRCSATHKESQTDSIEVDGADDQLPKSLWFSEDRGAASKISSVDHVQGAEKSHLQTKVSRLLWSESSRKVAWRTLAL